MSRMLVHASALLIPIAAEAISKHVVEYAVACVTVLYAASEAVRLGGRQMPLLTWFTLRMSSENEKAHLIVSPIFLAAGVILSLVLFPTHIAYASIGVVAAGDPVASFVGERFGGVRVGRKTLAGSTAGFLAAFAVSSLWVDPTLSLVGSLTGMLLELCVRFNDNPVGHFQIKYLANDNVIIPIGAGLAMLAASIL